MKRFKARRLLKWGCFTSSLLLFAAMAFSFWQEIGYADQSGGYILVDGAFAYLRFDYRALGQTSEGWWFCTIEPFSKGWWARSTCPEIMRLSAIHRDFVAIFVPLAPAILVLAVASALLWRRDRRIRPGHCLKCGYDLTGNVSGVCPECGTAINPGRVAQAL